MTFDEFRRKLLQRDFRPSEVPMVESYPLPEMSLQVMKDRVGEPDSQEPHGNNVVFRYKCDGGGWFVLGEISLGRYAEQILKGSKAFWIRSDNELALRFEDH